MLPKSVVSKIKNVDEYINTGKTVTLGVRPEDIHEDELFISNSPETIVKARIDVIEKLGAETQIYCDLEYENDKNTIVDNAAQMIARISSRAVVNLGEIVELAFDAKHIHLFDGYTEATMLERDEHYDVIPENAEGAAFVPPTPQEMQAQIDAARVVTKEMKKLEKQERQDGKEEGGCRSCFRRKERRRVTSRFHKFPKNARFFGGRSFAFLCRPRVGALSARFFCILFCFI